MCNLLRMSFPLKILVYGAVEKSAIIADGLHVSMLVHEFLSDFWCSQPSILTQLCTIKSKRCELSFLSFLGMFAIDKYEDTQGVAYNYNLFQCLVFHRNSQVT